MESYCQLLEKSARRTGNCACMGLDPQWDVLPYRSGDIQKDITRFFFELFEAMEKRNLMPAAFKPNIGYYTALDEPRKALFTGSLALVDILDILRKNFSGIPVILDAKRGDISRSSENYAHEAFDVWGCDAVTVSPYMGSDSIAPFAEAHGNEKGIYVLVRTSNRGSQELQSLMVGDGHPLYMSVAESVCTWNESMGCVGAVVGATHPEELEHLAARFSKKAIPLLIPGVGSQGADAASTIAALRNASYPLAFARINSSSAITHPWKQAPAPANWLTRCLRGLEQLLAETAL